MNWLRNLWRHFVRFDQAKTQQDQEILELRQRVYTLEQNYILLRASVRAHDRELRKERRETVPDQN